jgi:hypothetical protein
MPQPGQYYQRHLPHSGEEMQALIPELDDSTGHLPPGRFRVTLTEIHARFVAHDEFKTSPTRQAIWEGFVAYMTAWHRVEDRLTAETGGKPLVMCVWLGGSFVSRRWDPDNLDLTVLVDGELVDSCRGKPGIGGVRKLSHRDGMLATFKVSPCIVRYRYFRSPFRPQLVGNPDIEDYVMLRGAFDDWWQRVRPDGEPKGEPTRETASVRRGYLEVEA